MSRSLTSFLTRPLIGWWGRSITAGIILASFCLSACQTVRPIKITELQYLQTPEDARQDLPAMKPLSAEQSAQMGYYLFDPEASQVVEQQNADQFFIPASTSKVPTTVAALTLLGGDYRFKTYLAYQGTIKNGILEGDLYLKGTGDPVLKVPHWITFQKVLAAHGITRVDGHFYYDETVLKPATVIEEGREFWAPYNGGVSALSIDFNQFNMRWHRSREGLAHLIYSVPEFPFVQVGLLPQELTKETKFLFESTAESDRWLLSETQGQGGHQNLPVRRPALAAAYLFSDLCATAGVTLPAPEAGEMPNEARILITHSSPPLIDLVDDVLEYSNNLMAELIQLAAARSLVKRPVDIAEATQLISDWLTKREFRKSVRDARDETTAAQSKPIDSSEYHFVNGSGITAKNRITPAQLVGVMALADRFNFAQRTYESLLPISGYKGDLIHRLSLPGYAFHVRAKTGSMNYVNALTGYLYTRSGKRLIFAIMNSNFKERLRLDQSPKLSAISESHPLVPPVAPPISDSELKKAEHWSRFARQTQDHLLADWIQRY